MNTGTFKIKRRLLVGLLSPGLAIYCFAVIVPLFISVIYSLYNWSGGKNMRFAGLGNFTRLIHDGTFWAAFYNNIVIVVLCIIGQIGISLVIAILLYSKLLKFKEFARTVIFFPVVLSAVVVGFIWILVYDLNMGLLDWFLRFIGLGYLAQPWLANPHTVIFWISLSVIWQYIGFYLVIIMAAMQGIPKEIFEAADIDGASGMKKSLYVTLPMLSNTIKVIIMLCIAGNMKIFDNIFVMTRGGPGNSSMVMAMYAYNNSFVMMKLGYGSAISVAIIILSLALIFLSRLAFGRNNNEAA